MIGLALFAAASAGLRTFTPSRICARRVTVAAGSKRIGLRNDERLADLRLVRQRLFSSRGGSSSYLRKQVGTLLGRQRVDAGEAVTRDAPLVGRQQRPFAHPILRARLFVRLHARIAIGDLDPLLLGLEVEALPVVDERRERGPLVGGQFEPVRMLGRSAVDVRWRGLRDRSRRRRAPQRERS